MSYLSELLGNAYKEGMSEDEISAALESRSAETESELDRLKAALSKANSEAAKYKKDLRAAQGDKKTAADEHDTLMSKIADLERSIAVSDTKAKLMAMGYDEALAAETAAAMADSDMETVMKNQQQFLELQKKTILAEKMRSTPRPSAGAPNADVNPFAKDSYNLTEQGRLLRANPETARELAAAAGAKI